MQSSFCNSFEYQASLDEIYECPIYKLIAVTWFGSSGTWMVLPGDIPYWWWNIILVSSYHCTSMACEMAGNWQTISIIRFLVIDQVIIGFTSSLLRTEAHLKSQWRHKSLWFLKSWLFVHQHIQADSTENIKASYITNSFWYPLDKLEDSPHNGSVPKSKLCITVPLWGESTGQTGGFLSQRTSTTKSHGQHSMKWFLHDL